MKTFALGITSALALLMQISSQPQTSTAGQNATQPQSVECMSEECARWSQGFNLFNPTAKACMKVGDADCVDVMCYGRNVDEGCPYYTGQLHYETQVCPDDCLCGNKASNSGCPTININSRLDLLDPNL